jgi:hypothetical protein
MILFIFLQRKKKKEREEGKKLNRIQPPLCYAHMRYQQKVHGKLHLTPF